MLPGQSSNRPHVPYPSPPMLPMSGFLPVAGRRDHGTGPLEQARKKAAHGTWAVDDSITSGILSSLQTPVNNSGSVGAYAAA